MSILRVDFTHSKMPGTIFAEIPIPLGFTTDAIKEKLQFRVGTAAKSMDLFLRRADGGFVHLESGTPSDGGSKTTLHDLLSALGVDISTRLEILIKDRSEASDLASNVHANVGSKGDPGYVDKYVMPDEVYDALPNSMRKFLSTVAQSDANCSGQANGSGQASENKTTRLNDLSLNFDMSNIRGGERVETIVGGFRGEVVSAKHVSGGSGTLTCLMDEPITSDIAATLSKALKDKTGVQVTQGREFVIKILQGDKSGKSIEVHPALVSVGDYPPVDPFAEFD